MKNEGNWPWCSKEENGKAEPRYRFTLTSLSNPRRCIGFARRRIGRGGRVILDRVTTDYDDLWRTLDFTIVEPQRIPSETSAASRDEIIGDTIPIGVGDASSVVVKSELVVSANSCSNVGGATWTNDGYTVDSGIYSGTSGSISVSSNSFGSNRIDSAPSASATNFTSFEVKKELIDVKDEDGVAPLVDVQQHQQEQQKQTVVVKTEEDKDEMVECLRSLRRDW